MPPRESDRLHSWKEIAAFLGCDPRTAQRYELLRGLPVHRLPGGGIPKVFAYTAELRAWLDGNDGQPEPSVPAPAPRRLWPVPIFLAAALFAGWLARPRDISLAANPLRLATLPGAKLPPLLTDGKSVYFQESGNATFRLAVVSLSGGPSAPLSIPLASADPGVLSPDGKSLLLRSVQANKDGDEPLYLQVLPNAPPQRLGDIRAYDSAWLPGSRGIVFSRLRSVYTANLDGSSVRKRFDVPGRAYWFRWSPDGQTLRFTVYDSKLARYSIWQTSASLDLPPSPVSFGIPASPQQCCGAWSPDGSVYFFQASINGFFHVFAHAERFWFLRRPAVQLTQGNANYRSPLPAGDRLLTLSQTLRAEIVQFDSKLQRWLPLLEGVSAATAAFSPDGKSIAFTRFPDHSLWRCDFPACSHPVSLIPFPARVTMPRWSPDSSQVACMVKTPDSEWRAAIVPANASRPWEPLPAEHAEADPGWSPEGGRLVFGPIVNPDTSAASGLHIFDSATRRSTPVAGSSGHHSPAWSPSGRHLAAIHAATRELAIYDFASARWTRRLPGVAAGYLNWSATGHRLFFLGAPPGKPPAVLAFDPLTGQSTQVADFATLKRPASSFGDWLGLAPGDTPLALRDLNTEEILSWQLHRP